MSNKANSLAWKNVSPHLKKSDNGERWNKGKLVTQGKSPASKAKSSAHLKKSADDLVRDIQSRVAESAKSDSIWRVGSFPLKNVTSSEKNKLKADLECLSGAFSLDLIINGVVYGVELCDGKDFDEWISDLKNLVKDENLEKTTSDDAKNQFLKDLERTISAICLIKNSNRNVWTAKESKAFADKLDKAIGLTILALTKYEVTCGFDLSLSLINLLTPDSVMQSYFISVLFDCVDLCDNAKSQKLVNSLRKLTQSLIDDLPYQQSKAGNESQSDIQKHALAGFADFVARKLKETTEFENADGVREVKSKYQPSDSSRKGRKYSQQIADSFAKACKEGFILRSLPEDAATL